MQPRRVAGLLALAIAFIAAACGTDDSPLAQTERNMAELKAGALDLRLAASAGDDAKQTGPVGFRLRGPFSFSGDHELAVFDLTYTRLLGDTQRSSRVRSTGEAAYVTVDGATQRVAEDDLGSLRISDETGGISDLGIAGWVRDPKVTPGDKVDGVLTDVITGEVDAADMLSDLARIGSSVGGDTQLSSLDGEAGERLQKLVKSSSIRVVTTAKGRQLRSLRALVDFGTKTPAALRDSLGPYADARLEVTLSMRSGSRNLRVSAPAV